MESFDDHPPLVIPSHSCIDLSAPIEDEMFNQHLQSIKSTFEPATEGISRVYKK